MAESEKISPLPPERISQHFSALREKGLELIADYAAESWTDHNVHDPGITFLEAYCYALTDIGFRTQLEIADLIQSGEKQAPIALEPAHRVLPCAPVTFSDLRKVLLDHYLIQDAWVTTASQNETAIYQDSASTPPLTYLSGTQRISLSGLYEVLLTFRDTGLNSNSYLLTVESDGIEYSLDISLPNWDEADSVLFRQPISLLSIDMVDDGTGIWRALDEDLTYFAQIRTQYGPGPDDFVQIWLVLRIVDDFENTESKVPDILTGAATLIETLGPDSLIEKFSQRVSTAYRNVEIIQRYLFGWRNLTEYPMRLSVVREQEIAVCARIQVNSGIDLELLLANLFLAIDSALSPPCVFDSLSELTAADKKTTEIYDGPLLKNGFLVESANQSSADSQPLSKIYTSDILNLIMQWRNNDADASPVTTSEAVNQREIISVSNLTLSNFINNRLINKDATDCLRLVETARYRPRLSITKSQIVIINNDNEFGYDFSRVRELFERLISERDANHSTVERSSVWPVMPGDKLPVDDYYPYQHELPPVYGVGEAGLPDNAGTARKSQALQTKAYLLLSEQFLADATAQLANINRFFSPLATENQSRFIFPLFDLPGMEKLLKRFNPENDWLDFISDPANPYRTALQNASETEEQFLNRRNRMFDHLLARFGMEATSWSQELHRRTYSELSSAGLETAEFQEKLKIRRHQVNALLIKMKAAFLSDVPQLNAIRHQGFGNPVVKNPEMVNVTESGGEYHWQLVVNDEILLQSAADLPSRCAALNAAEDAVVLASQSSFYRTVNATGGRYRYELRDGPELNNRVVAESHSTWASESSAEEALQSSAAVFFSLAISSSMTPMERIIAHQAGLAQRRRKLLVDIDSYFEIYDEVDTDGIIEKRWRLWEKPGYDGNVLLSSIYHFTAPPEIVLPPEQEAAAIALAEASIAEAIKYGVHEWNYTISQAGTETFNFELQDTTGHHIGHYNPPLASVDEAEQAIADTTLHLYTLYSTEGFHTVEHILLRPLETSDTFLSVPINKTEKASDPYSHQMSLIFPSGYAKDFSLTEPQRIETTPHRFRDLQFRAYIERLVRQTCPAHILPKIYWVDRQLAGTSDSPASFNVFEQRYFDWMEGLLIPGIDYAVLKANREALVQSLNEIANG